MLKTLRISLSLRNTYRVNSILYSLKQIPLIKKLLPSSLYGIWGFKIFANIISVIGEIISAFLGKLFYFLLMIFLVVKLMNTTAQGDLFVHIIFFLSIIGSIMNTFLFNPSKDKYYGIILMRMNARSYSLVNYGYSLLKLLAGFSVFGLLFGRLVGLPVWTCLMIPLFVVGLKLTVAAYNLYDYEKKGNTINESKPEKIIWIATLILLGAAYGLPVMGIIMPRWLMVSLMGIPILTGSISVRKIYNFRFYRECYQQLFESALFHKNVVVNFVREQNNKLISEDVTITSKRKGFEYFNELFIKRHHKLLWKSSKRLALISLGLILLAMLLFHQFPEILNDVNSFILSRLPWFVFIMYGINRGTSFTKVLFMNCDHSLLSYSFYKQPKFVLKLFCIRLREIMKINLLPAIIISTGMALLLFVSGGTEDVLNYVVLVVSIPMLSMFFSVHYLTVYYLLQPYNAGTEMKSPIYQIVITSTYVVCFNIMKLKISTLMFGAMTILFCLLYCLVAFVIVYRIAPKTFKLRQ